MLGERRRHLGAIHNYAEGGLVPGSPAQPYYYGPDQIGSVRRVFASASSAPAYGYDPYGNALRWLSRDPIGETSDSRSISLYAYANETPTTTTDPDGLDPPDFIGAPGGTAYPIPQGAQGPYSTRGTGGIQYQGGSGGNGLDSRVTGFHYMPPGMSGPYSYPGGRGMYNNSSGQIVDPGTGRTIPPGDPMSHIPGDNPNVCPPAAGGGVGGSSGGGGGIMPPQGIGGGFNPGGEQELLE
jgi:hypothetical protein